ncbi:uncharacterized protein L3040_002912 [Drepanopeziza brunnea f. sp. 'multigermtubi']|uniref:uncharacterized protein n=1 Tax=Drepanopeziza brunnea f. sp. 'multigermtubi' TaxID=698441 RepID=UPI00239F02FE|nr:hypothetical protein L3040_002912 [Drepanopeziza brunnea f. sp. 'multigermtubi']
MKPTSLQSTLGWTVAGLASLSTAQITFSPGPSYGVAIPSGSSISASSTGPLYVRLSAPTTYQWVALGTGAQMAGSTMFVMYADGAGNVTISGRKSSGHSQPKMDSTIQGGLTLLEGSGIVDGNMVANVKCTTCTLDSDASSSSSPWIAAWSMGSALDSTSTSANINQHGGSSTAQVQLDLAGQATIASDSNPFISSAAGGSSGTSGGSTTGTGNSGGVSFGNSNFGAVADYQKAHGIIMGVVMVLLFPFAAMFIRMGGNGMVHAILQMLNLCALIVGLGLGVKLADMTHVVGSPFSKRQWSPPPGFDPSSIPGFGNGSGGAGGSGSGGSSTGGSGNGASSSTLGGAAGASRAGRLGIENLSSTHTIFGVVIVVLFLIQPIFGIIHHMQYKRNQARAPVSHLHIWYGRVIILLGVINGGLGLKLARNSPNGVIAYSVVAGVVGLAYVLMCVFKRKGGAPPLWKTESDVGMMRMGSQPQAPPQYDDVDMGHGAPPHYPQRTVVK